MSVDESAYHLDTLEHEVFDLLICFRMMAEANMCGSCTISAA